MKEADRPRRKLLSLIMVGVLAGLVMLTLKKSGSLVGSPAPGFALPVVHDQVREPAQDPGRQPDGERVRLEDLRGSVVVLDFWASWCGPCRHSVGTLNRAAATLASEKVRFYGINPEGLSPQQVANVARAWGMTYPVLHDPTAATLVAYQVSAFPTLLLVDADGVVRTRFDGSPGADELIESIRKLAR